jgi:hypothetical protein
MLHVHRHAYTCFTYIGMHIHARVIASEQCGLVSGCRTRKKMVSRGGRVMIHAHNRHTDVHDLADD